MKKRFEISARGFSAYLWCVIALTLVGIALRTASMFLFFDYDINYYSAGAALPLISNIFFALSAVAITVVSVGAREIPFTADGNERGIVIKLASFICTLSFILSASETLGAVTLIPSAVLTTVLYVSAVYFLLNLTRSPSSAQALTSVALIISLASFIALSYFDTFTQMNSPLKVHLHLAMLASMLFITAEARAIIGMIKKRFYLFSLSMAVFFTGVASVPNATAILAGKLEYNITPFYYIFDLVTFFLFVYFLCRLVRLNSFVSNESETVNDLPAAETVKTITEEDTESNKDTDEK